VSIWEVIQSSKLNGPGTVEYEEPHGSSEGFGKEFVFEARQVGMESGTLLIFRLQDVKSRYNIENHTSRTCHGGGEDTNE
jgi:hypothetical protein